MSITPSLREQVIMVGQRWSAAQHRLLELVVALEESGEWAVDGATTCAHWVADALDVEVCTAREWLRIGRKLKALTTINEAFVDGRLSYSKVRTLTRVATPANESELEAIAEDVPAGRLAHALAGWLTRHETPEETEARHRAARTMSWRVDPDGMVAAFVRLPPADAQVLMRAIDTETARRPESDASADASERWPSVAQQRADALVRLIGVDGAALVTEIVVHVRGDGCTFDDGTPVAETFVERIAPSSFLRALIHDAEGHPINASGRQRHPTHRQQRVVAARDRACVDCGATEFLEYDHEPAFDVTRRTVVDELRLRCWTCHRARHARVGVRRGASGAGRS
jgi:hypothetical protein